jgi:hypothetical protein
MLSAHLGKNYDFKSIKNGIKFYYNLAKKDELKEILEYLANNDFKCT